MPAPGAPRITSRRDATRWNTATMLSSARPSPSSRPDRSTCSTWSWAPLIASQWSATGRAVFSHRSGIGHGACSWRAVSSLRHCSATAVASVPASSATGCGSFGCPAMEPSAARAVAAMKRTTAKVVCCSIQAMNGGGFSFIHSPREPK